MNDDKRTMYDLAVNAVQCQDACNLSGVVHSFSRDITRLRALTDDKPGFSTTMLNQHPVCALYASKIHDLSGMGVSDFTAFGDAYNWCQAVVARGKDADPSTYPELPRR